MARMASRYAGGVSGGGIGGTREASWHGGASVRETRVIAGRPAEVIYNKSDRYFPLTLMIYDRATKSGYVIYGGYGDAGRLRGANVDAVVAIGESLFAGE